MRIALATCRALPDWEVDDAPLHDALRRRGVEVLSPAWDDEGFGWEACDACLIRTTWDYMERRDAFVAWAERVARRTRLFNPPELVRWNTHKSYLRDLERHGAPVLPTIWLDSVSHAGHQLDAGQPIDSDRQASIGQLDMAEAMKQRGWTQGFLKPVVGATARETLRFAADASGLAAARAHLARLLPCEAMLLQPYFESVEREGEFSAIFFDGRFSHAVRKVPAAGDYRVQDDFGAHDEPWRPAPGEIEIAQRIVDSVAPSPLYARVDFLRSSQGRLCCNELELVEPSLFFRHCPTAADRLAECLLARLGAGVRGASPS